MRLLSGNAGRARETNDAMATVFVPLVKSPIEAPHVTLGDRDGKIELKPAPSDIDAVASGLAVRNFGNVNRKIGRQSLTHAASFLQARAPVTGGDSTARNPALTFDNVKPLNRSFSTVFDERRMS